MKSYKQFLVEIKSEEIDVKRNEENDSHIRTILGTIEDDKLIVQFALYCAKDSSKFSENEAKSRECIVLIEKLLKDESTVSSGQLWDAMMKTNVSPAMYAVETAYYSKTNSTYIYSAAVNTATSAIHDFVVRGNINNEEHYEISERKIAEYERYANLLMSKNTYTLKTGNHSFLHDHETKSQEENIKSLAIMFDQLDEVYEQQDKDNPLTTSDGNNVKLNLAHYRITAKNNYSLAKEIVEKYPMLVRFIHEFYKKEVS